MNQESASTRSESERLRAESRRLRQRAEALTTQLKTLAGDFAAQRDRFKNDRSEWGCKESALNTALIEETRTREAMLFMLEDLEKERRAITRAQRDWKASVDAVPELLLLHDESLRVMRCNRAYAKHAGMSFKDIIGRPYWECFPKGGGPLPDCVACLDPGAASRAPVELALASGEVFLSAAYALASADGGARKALHVFEDVTERKRAERELQESEARYRRLTEILRDTIYRCDPATFAISYISPASQELYGYAVSEWAADPELFFKTVHPEDRARVMEHFARTLREGEAAPLEYRIVKKGGEVRWVEDRPSYERDDGGRIVAMAGVMSDITERRRKDVQLRLFREIVDNAPTQLEIIDPETLRYLDVNNTACKALGYTPGEMMALRVHDVQALGIEFIERVNERLRSTGSAQFEGLHRRKDGTTYPVEVAVKRIELDRPYYISAVNDITERNRTKAALAESEQRYRGLFEGSHDAQMTLEPPSWRFTSANQALLRVFRVPSIEQFIALTPWQISPERQPDGQLSSEKARAMIARAMQEGSHFFEWEHQRLDGERFAADVLLTRLEIGGGILLQATLRDISARKRMEETARRQLEELKSWHTMTLGREERVLELKREVNALLARSNEPARYATAGEAQPETEMSQ